MSAVNDPVAIDDATLSLVAHNLRGSIGIAVGAIRTVRLRWEQLDEQSRDQLLQMVERSMGRIDDAAFGIARGLPAPIIVELQRGFEAADEAAEGPWPAPLPDDEEKRLAALRRYAVLDQDESADLNAVARLAAEVTGSPMAVINLIDADRQWQAAAYGTERVEVRREESMCAVGFLDRRTIHVPDSTKDPRYAANPFVNGHLGNIRMYAAAPLVAPGNHAVGTICAFDEQPRELSDTQLARLEDLARIVTALFEQRALSAELGAAATWQHELIADLERERRRNEHLLERLSGGESMDA